MYKIAVDKGMDSANALQLYEEAKAFDNEAGNVANATGNVGTRRIHSGFYVDKRNRFKAVPRMFLIINQGKTSNKCVGKERSCHSLLPM